MSKQKIILLDDIHLEGRPDDMIFKFKEDIQNVISNTIENNETPILVLAGDIGEGLNGVKWAKDFQCPIIYVCGNHEFWGQDYFEQIANMQKITSFPEYSHINFLNNSSVILNGIRFIGTTLWTDLGSYLDWEDNNYVIKYFSVMGDFKRITAKKWYNTENINKINKLLEQHGVVKEKINEIIEKQLFNPLLEIEENKKATEFLIKELEKPFDGTTIVVTHHLPFKEVWMKLFNIKEDLLNKNFINQENIFLEAARGKLQPSMDLLMLNLYSNNLLPLLKSKKAPNYWLHGHLHIAVDEIIGKTRVMSSPVGYYKQSSELRLKEIALENSKEEISKFIKYKIESYPWNTQIINNLIAFEKIILQYVHLIQEGYDNIENFRIIAQSFIKNHEYSKKIIEQDILELLNLLYIYDNPDKIDDKINSNIRNEIKFNQFLNKFNDRKCKKIFPISIEINEISFYSEHKFSQIKSTHGNAQHYKDWLKELTLSKLNINLYKKTLINFCENYKYL